MKTSKLLESYKKREITEPNQLDLVSREFKNIFIDFIEKTYLSTNISNQHIVEKLRSKFGSLIKVEYNTISIPYYYLLENINLCVEVEMSNDISNREQQKKFGKVKFSEILESGIQKLPKIKRFANSEEIFVENIKDFIKLYTNDFSIDEDSIKIEFN